MTIIPLTPTTRILRRRHAARLITTMAALLAAAPLATPAPAEAAAPRVEIRIGDLPTGPAPQVPVAVSKSVHDGDVVTPLPGQVQILGTTATGDVVAVATGRRLARVFRIGPDGGTDVTKLATTAAMAGATLSDDGGTLAVREPVEGGDSRVRVLSTTDGSELAVRVFTGYQVPIGASDQTVYLTTPQGTSAWTVGGGVRRISSAHGYLARPGLDLLATVPTAATGNGCTTLRRLSDPSTELWSSCTEWIESISPDGKRLLTLPIQVQPDGDHRLVRTVEGRLISRYDAPKAYFVAPGWEDAHTLLVGVGKGDRSAYVRCGTRSCERASGPGPLA